MAEANGPIRIAGRENATQRRDVEIADPVVSKSLIRKTKFIILMLNCERTWDSQRNLKFLLFMTGLN